MYDVTFISKYNLALHCKELTIRFWRLETAKLQDKMTRYKVWAILHLFNKQKLEKTNCGLNLLTISVTVILSDRLPKHIAIQGVLCAKKLRSNVFCGQEFTFDKQNP